MLPSYPEYAHTQHSFMHTWQPKNQNSTRFGHASVSSPMSAWMSACMSVCFCGHVYAYLYFYPNFLVCIYFHIMFAHMYTTGWGGEESPGVGKVAAWCAHLQLQHLCPRQGAWQRAGTGRERKKAWVREWHESMYGLLCTRWSLLCPLARVRVCATSSAMSTQPVQTKCNQKNKQHSAISSVRANSK